ncbi:uncharacterized protein LOC118198641 [Stegodyphus dumicola]|uniref:uncharacterized protein LOC118198641 n=1 Tax=Stegodyphus dumicola TaxID=202533 RepID=UPI0015ABE3DF|nr:uncharacterized protein LOC118198641 [Stegodyphus dumicola]
MPKELNQVSIVIIVLLSCASEQLCGTSSSGGGDMHAEEGRGDLGGKADENPRVEYQNHDEQNNEETHPEAIYVRGLFTYKDAQGIERTVEYVADENGFQAISPTSGTSN